MLYSFPKVPARAALFRHGANAKLSAALPESLKNAVREFAQLNGLTFNRAVSALLLAALEVGPLVRLSSPQLEVAEKERGRTV